MSKQAELLPLWPGMEYHHHQKVGIEFMLEKERVGTVVPIGGGDSKKELTIYGGFQCDGMGLGKTIQALSVVRHNPRPLTLILAPVAMLATWVENGERAGFPCFTLDKSKWNRTASTAATEGVSLYITNYESVVFRSSLIGEAVWDRIILDESHRIRVPTGETSSRVIQLRAKYRWAMSGTPIVNRMRDVVTQFAFLGVPPADHYSWKADVYEPLIGEMVIHRSMEEIRGIVKTVPPVPEIETHELEFISKEEGDFYHGLQGLRNSIKYARESSIEILEMLLRLRQSSVSPSIYMEALKRKDSTYDKVWKAPSTKMVALGELVQEEPKHKFLVFCSFHDEMELLAAYLKKVCGTVAELYHGGIPSDKREAVLDRAREPSCRVLLIQLQSGGVGLNLQEFDRCVFMCPWWTSALMDQAIARAVRIGQAKKVRVIHFVLSDVEEGGLNIDSLMMEIAEKKRELLIDFFAKVKEAE